MIFWIPQPPSILLPPPMQHHTSGSWHSATFWKRNYKIVGIDANIKISKKKIPTGWHTGDLFTMRTSMRLVPSEIPGSPPSPPPGLHWFRSRQQHFCPSGQPLSGPKLSCPKGGVSLPSELLSRLGIPNSAPGVHPGRNIQWRDRIRS